jgi:hypothetical protein
MVLLIACQDDLQNVKFYDGELRVELHGNCTRSKLIVPKATSFLELTVLPM